ncbi:hypothetical protein GCM10023235_78080 [Kitasatospora terrestris]|uniref:M23ase beta-sheet core domain-containing protein n=1 Tax=Kitasatospora terrestris TaxID=258051 RepID=A0ABP9EY11_9ACTN
MGLQPFPGADFFHDGQVSPIITAMGQRLVEEGCSRYQVGPGPAWSSADQDSYAAFQRKLGFSDGDADGIPGQTSWDRLHVPSVNGGPHRASSPVPGHGITTAYHINGPHWSLGYHTGADYAADNGTPCVAVLDGSISRTGTDASFGNYLVLRADNGTDYWYCHLSERDVGDGAGVGAGQRVGLVGQSGNATGPHLHFERRPAGGGFGSDISPDW